LHRGTCRYEGDAAELSLDFTVADDFFGAVVTRELRPGGADMEVTDANKMLYVHLVADWRLNGCMRSVAGAVVRGMAAVVNPNWLRLFNPREVLTCHNKTGAHHPI
jgi:ubiquitin-protein ligase E3 C